MDSIGPFALVAAYIVGSLDFAVVVARSHGVDIYAVGSGNPGTSNVMRSLGRGAAAMTMVGDLLKGFVGAAMGFVALGTVGAAAGGSLAVVGHCFPVFHRFRGGKGVATAAGMMLWVSPLAALLLAGVWVVAVAVTRVASIGSLLVLVSGIPLAWWTGVEGWSLVFVGATVLLVLIRHRGNIQRIVNRGERTVGDDEN